MRVHELVHNKSFGLFSGVQNYGNMVTISLLTYEFVQQFFSLITDLYYSLVMLPVTDIFSGSTLSFSKLKYNIMVKQ